MFGSQIVTSIDSIRCLCSRDDTLRLPITNDEDLDKVITIAETNKTTKLSFLLIRQNNVNDSQIQARWNSYNSISISDDEQQTALSERGIESPPPGTIVPQKRRTTVNKINKSIMSKDGGVFIPESVSFYFISF